MLGNLAHQSFAVGVRHPVLWFDLGFGINFFLKVPFFGRHLYQGLEALGAGINHLCVHSSLSEYHLYGLLVLTSSACDRTQALISYYMILNKYQGRSFCIMLVVLDFGGQYNLMKIMPFALSINDYFRFLVSLSKKQ